jgi:hypothetical protein
MNLVEVTSLIGAVGGVSATALSFLVFLRQRKSEMRKSPIFQFFGPFVSEELPEIEFWEIHVTSLEPVGYTFLGVKARKPILFRAEDIWATEAEQNEPILSGRRSPFKKDASKARGYLAIEVKRYPNAQHYRIPLSISSNRSKISLIWRWNDEAKLRRTKKRLTSTPSITS